MMKFMPVMKFFSLSLCLLLSVSLSGQPCKKAFSRYLEPQSKLIDCEGNHSVEQLPDGRFVQKRYLMESMLVTHYITYATDDLQVRDGMYIERWDDGTVFNQGIYLNNMREGKWLVDGRFHGTFSKGLKEGSWKYFREDSTLISEENYAGGVLHGTRVAYDTLGNMLHTAMYDHGTLISTTQDTLQSVLEKMPAFQGCDATNLDGDALQTCSNERMLQFIYSNLKYPAKDRINGIEGKALIQFVIDKEGNVTDIEIRNGVSPTIRTEVLRIMRSMPAWSPGIQNDNPVRVAFTLPIKFSLE
jgi:TonB family protein